MERICKNCRYFVVTGMSFDPRSRLILKFGVCQKPGSSAKKVKGKLVGGTLKLDDETCKIFKPQQNLE